MDYYARRLNWNTCIPVCFAKIIRTDNSGANTTTLLQKYIHKLFFHTLTDLILTFLFLLHMSIVTLRNAKCLIFVITLCYII